MENTQTHLHISRRPLVGFAVAGVLVLVTTLLVTGQRPAPTYQGDIPLPFLQRESTLKGSVSFYGKRNNLDVYEISFKQNERVERMQVDVIYLVHVPTGADVVTTSLDDVISTFSAPKVKNVDYYGYKYVDGIATAERAAVQAAVFRNRFPGKFFASKKARDNDPARSNDLAKFEVANGITFVKTDGTAGVAQLEPGALYAFIVNESGGANIAIRTSQCPNGILESSETCDDGNTDNADACKNNCTLGTSYSSSSSSSAASSVASSVASSQASSSQASSVASSQASSSQASSVASSQASSSQASSVASSQASSVASSQASSSQASSVASSQASSSQASSEASSIASSQASSSQASSQASSESVSSQASSQPAVAEYPLSINVLEMPATATAAPGQGMSLFKFNVVAGSEDVLLKGMMFTLQQGTYQNAVQYELFRAGTTDTVASAIPDDSNTLTFYKAGGLGGVLVAGTPVTFEVRALSATAPAADPKLQIRFLTSATNYIIGMAGGTILKDIRTNDVSIFPCDINVKTLPATLWTLSTSQ